MADRASFPAGVQWRSGGRGIEGGVVEWGTAGVNGAAFGGVWRSGNAVMSISLLTMEAGPPSEGLSLESKESSSYNRVGIT